MKARKVTIDYTVQSDNLDLEAEFKVRANVWPGEKATYWYPGSPPEVEIYDAELLKIFGPSGQMSEKEVDELRSVVCGIFWSEHEGTTKLEEQILSQASDDEIDDKESEAEARFQAMRDGD